MYQRRTRKLFFCPQIQKFLGSFRFRKSAFFSCAVLVPKSQIRKFFIISSQVSKPQIFYVCQSANRNQKIFHHGTPKDWVENASFKELIPFSALSLQNNINEAAGFSAELFTITNLN